MPDAYHLGSHDVLLGYHAMLLNDPHRMDAYERAVRALVKPGMVVLDLGAGTGIWGLLAARRGARVHLVESGPVAGVARQLAEHNGLSDRVTVHQADMLTLPVAEPVDLVISEFMGRFVVDDGMLAAVAAAEAWMKPTARFAPEHVALRIAPASLTMPQVEAFSRPAYGLDLSCALPYLHHTCYAAQLPPSALLADAQTVAELRPPRVTGPIRATLQFTISQSQRLNALAGWFVATLCDDIALSTEPGVQTHWQQYIFPIPAVFAQAGDVLTAALWLDDPTGSATWRWRGQLSRGGTLVARFDQSSDQNVGDRHTTVGPPAPYGTDALREAVRRANQASADGQLLPAAHAWEAAAQALSPADDAHAHAIYESLGLARMQLGQLDAAIRAFLRALDGELSSRELSLRWLVSTLATAGRHEDAARALLAYEAAFGPHPDARRA